MLTLLMNNSALTLVDKIMKLCISSNAIVIGLNRRAIFEKHLSSLLCLAGFSMKTQRAIFVGFCKV